MIPAFYVVRSTRRAKSGRLIVESRPFQPQPDIFGVEARDRARFDANRWADFVRIQHPRHDVHVVELLAPFEQD